MSSQFPSRRTVVSQILGISALIAVFVAAGCGGGGNGYGGGGGTPSLGATVTSTGNFSSGEQGATYTINVRNSGTAATSGTVTVVDPPMGFTVITMSGTGWTCTVTVSTTTCTYSNTVAAGQPFPPITVTGNVTAANGSTVTIALMLSGGGTTGTVTVTPTPTVSVAAVALSISKGHTGNFVQGGTGTYSVGVSNGAGAGATSGTVTVTDTPPSGETITAMAGGSGSMWMCTVTTFTCMRSDPLPGGMSYDTINVTVSVSTTASSPQINKASMSGGNQSGTVSISDSTTIIIPPSLSITKTHSGSFTEGQLGATYTVTVSNAASAGPTDGFFVTVKDTVPSGETLVSMSGTGWTCPVVTLVGTFRNECRRSDVLAAGANYPPITVTVNVKANATSPQVNMVSVSGGGSASASAPPDSTVINAAPVLSITKTHGLNFSQGGTGTYTVTVMNGGLAPTFGAVTVTEMAPPTGLTVTAMSGMGWTCVVATMDTCTRTDVLTGGGTYPAITVSVSVATSAPSSLTNSVTVTGGSSASATASDLTIITPPGPCSGSPIGSESKFGGNWGLLGNGYQGGSNGTPVVMVAGIAPNQVGGFSDLGGGSGGDLDINMASGHQHLTITAASSSYTLGPDPTSATAGDVGCMSLTLSGGTLTSLVIRFTVGGVNGAGKGDFIEYDDSTGTGTRLSGVIWPQDSLTFSSGDTSNLNQYFAIGADGTDHFGAHAALAGYIHLNTTTGLIDHSDIDYNDLGHLIINDKAGTGSIMGVSRTTGRAVFAFNPNVTGALPITDTMIILNPHEAFFISDDPLSSTAMLSGRAIATNVTGTFTGASLSGNYVSYETGIIGCPPPTGTTPCAAVLLGFATFTPGSGNSGALGGTAVLYYDSAPAVQVLVTPAGVTYSVDPTYGRVVTATTSNPTAPVLYPTGAPWSDAEPIAAFAIGSGPTATTGDKSAAFGFLEVQPPPPTGGYSTAGLAGNYFFRNEDMADNTVTNATGVVNVASTGALSDIEYKSGQSGLATAAVSGGPVHITNKDPLGGNAPGMGDVGPNTVAITNGTKLWFINTGTGKPASITVVEH